MDTKDWLCLCVMLKKENKIKMHRGLLPARLPMHLLRLQSEVASGLCCPGRLCLHHHLPISEHRPPENSVLLGAGMSLLCLPHRECCVQAMTSCKHSMYGSGSLLETMLYRILSWDGSCFFGLFFIIHETFEQYRTIAHLMTDCICGHTF